MTDHQKPWDSTKPYDEYTDIESVFLWAYDDLFTGHAAVVERAWAALFDKCKEGIAMSETAKERERRWLRERADAEDKCQSVAAGGSCLDGSFAESELVRINAQRIMLADLVREQIGCHDRCGILTRGTPQCACSWCKRARSALNE